MPSPEDFPPDVPADIARDLMRDHERADHDDAEIPDGLHGFGHGADNEAARAFLGEPRDAVDAMFGRPGVNGGPVSACAKCLFAEPMPGGEQFSCRKRPPVVHIATIKAPKLPAGLLAGNPQPEDALQALTTFPTVLATEWCGEFEARSRPTAVDD